MNTFERLYAGELDGLVAALYGNSRLEEKKNRIYKAAEQFKALYGAEEELRLFSAPGRTEIGGNHTDHNHGCVLAGSVDLDVIAVVAFHDNGVVRIKSEGYDMDTVNLNELDIHPEENNKAIALIRGILARFQQLGYQI